MTDTYPRGKLCDEDEGGTQMAIGTRDRTVIVSFPKPTAWIGLDAATARNMGHILIARADEIEKERPQ